MSGGGKTTETVNQTQQLTLPPWLSQGAQRVFTDAERAAAENPIEAYGGPIVAGSNENLDRAGAAARSSQGVGQGDLNRSRDLAARGALAPTGRVRQDDWNASRMQDYANPYLEAVQERTTREMTRQNKMELDRVGDAAAGQRAFGGSRHAVLEAETRKGQNANMLDYLARSNQASYDDSYSRFASDRSARQGADATNAGLDAADANRRLSGSSLFNNLATTAQGMSTQDINNLIQTGVIDQNTANQLLGADYDEFLRMQDAPLQRQMQLMQMLGIAPANTTQTTNGTNTSRTQGSFLNTLLSAGSIGASFASDRRLKRDIEQVGMLSNGLGVYRYRYFWSPDEFIGVMADEVRKIVPDGCEAHLRLRCGQLLKTGGFRCFCLVLAPFMAQLAQKAMLEQRGPLATGGPQAPVSVSQGPLAPIDPQAAAIERARVEGIVSASQPEVAERRGPLAAIGDFIKSDEGRGALFRAGATGLATGNFGAGLMAGAGYIDDQKAMAAQQAEADRNFGLRETMTDANILDAAVGRELDRRGLLLETLRDKETMRRNRAGERLTERGQNIDANYKDDQIQLGYTQEQGRNSRNAATNAQSDTNNRRTTAVTARGQDIRSADSRYSTDNGGNGMTQVDQLVTKTDGTPAVEAGWIYGDAQPATPDTTRTQKIFALPGNPQNLRVGVIYQTQDGPMMWDGGGFLPAR